MGQLTKQKATLAVVSAMAVVAFVAIFRSSLEAAEAKARAAAVNRSSDDSYEAAEAKARTAAVNRSSDDSYEARRAKAFQEALQAVSKVPRVVGDVLAAKDLNNREAADVDTALQGLPALRLHCSQQSNISTDCISSYFPLRVELGHYPDRGRLVFNVKISSDDPTYCRELERGASSVSNAGFADIARSLGVGYWVGCYSKVWTPSPL